MQTVTSSSFHLHKAAILSKSMGESLPEKFDLVVVGTGLVESMVAAAAARLGHTVLHLDTASYYGGQWASFTWDGLQAWIREQKGEGEETKTAWGRGGEEEGEEKDELVLLEGERLVALNGKGLVQNLVETWHDENRTDAHKEEPSDCGGENLDHGDPEAVPPDPEWSREEIEKQSRRFNIDLVPRLLFSRGEMVELLISSNISRYTEFKAVTRVLTLLNGSLEQVPSSRADVFNTKHISVVEKRILMKFLTWCLQEDQPPCPDLTFGELLKKEKLTANLTHFVLHSIAMAEPGVSAQDGLKATKKFLSSLGRFGPTPFLWSMYGTGELPQAFCRLCAVFGGVYYLGRSLEGLVVKDGKAEAVVTEGRRIQCDQVVLPASLVPNELRLGEAEVSSTSYSRAVLLSKASLLPTDKEQLTFLSLPKEEKDGLRESAAHLIEVGSGTAACPKGLHLLHASTSGEVDLVDEVKPLVASSLLYSLSWQQQEEEHLTSDCATSLSNTFLAAGPRHELDLSLAIEAARSVHKKLYPEEEFLPRAPDPEEILIGGGEAEEKEAQEKEAHEKKEAQEKEAPAKEAKEKEAQEKESEGKETESGEEKLQGSEKELSEQVKQCAEDIPDDQAHDITEKDA